MDDRQHSRQIGAPFTSGEHCSVFIQMVIFHNDNNMITLTTFVHCTSGGESLHENRSASGSNLTIIEKETGTRLKGGLFATYVIPFVFLATSSMSNESI